MIAKNFPAPGGPQLVPDPHRVVLLLDEMTINFTVQPEPGDLIAKGAPVEPVQGTAVLKAGTRLMVESTTAVIPHVCTVAVGITIEGRPMTVRFQMVQELLKQIAQPVMVPAGAGQGGEG